MAPLHHTLVALALLACVPTCAPADAAPCTDAKTLKSYTVVKALMDDCTSVTSVPLTATTTKNQKKSLCEPCATLVSVVQAPTSSSVSIPTCTIDMDGNPRRLITVLTAQFKFCPGGSDATALSDASSLDTDDDDRPVSMSRPPSTPPHTLKPNTHAAAANSSMALDAHGSTTEPPAAATAASTTPATSMMSTGVLIGIISGAVVLLALLASAFVVRRRRQQQQQAAASSSTSHQSNAHKINNSSVGNDHTNRNENNPHDDLLPSTGRASSAPFHLSHTASSSTLQSDELFRPGSSLGPKPSSGNMWEDEAIVAVRVPRDKVLLTALLSRGGFGEVYLGMYNHTRVAVKTLLPETRKDLREINALLAEVKLMAFLDHPRIVAFIGVAWDSLADVCVVSEFMEGGDLRGLVVQFEHERRPHGFDALKIRIAVHVAHALTFMHSRRPVVLHRDLKSKNILLDAELNAKLTDFGVSRESSYRTMTAGVGTSLWMAPEVMLGGRYDDKADIFSFGIVLSELDTHAVPYAHFHDARAATGESNFRIPDSAVLQLVSLGRLQVQFSHEANPAIVALARTCIAIDPKERPTAADVLYTLHGILQGTM